MFEAVASIFLTTGQPNHNNNTTTTTMSRGGRGGFGGGRGGLNSAARMNTGAVPFEIDEDLEKGFQAVNQNEDSDSLFPVSPLPESARADHCACTQYLAHSPPLPFTYQ